MKIKTAIPKTIREILQGLNAAQMHEVIRFAMFIRTRPEQAYLRVVGNHDDALKNP